MEGIDIIELFKRVKEGKAPQEIEIDGQEYDYYPIYDSIEEMYVTSGSGGNWLDNEDVVLNTKIKIKTKIEKLAETENDIMTKAPDNFMIMHKINEIIDYINKH